jgi:hypothetical protein
LGIDALRSRLFSELKIELQTKDIESLIREFDNKNRKELNFPSLLSASQLTYEGWRKTRIRKSESKSARKIKQEEKAIAPDILGIMDIVKQASYNLLVANDCRIDISRPSVMDPSQFKSSLEELNIYISEFDRRALEERYSRPDISGKIDFTKFRSEFEFLGMEQLRDKEESRVPLSTTGRQQAELDCRNSAHLDMLSKFDSNIGIDFDASCSLDMSMSLNIMASAGQKNKGQVNSQFMNKMVLTNVALEDIFAVNASANNTPDKQKIAPTTFENRRNSKGNLKPLPPPLAPLSESELISECTSRTELVSECVSRSSVDCGTTSSKAAISELSSTGPGSDESDTDRSPSREPFEKDRSRSPPVTLPGLESSRNTEEQSNITLVPIVNIKDVDDTNSLDSRLSKAKSGGRTNSSDRLPSLPAIIPKKSSKGDLADLNAERLNDIRSNHASDECPPVASAVPAVSEVRTEKEKAAAVNNDDVIEAITRRLEEAAAAERKSALSRIKSVEIMGFERRNSFQRSESADLKPVFVPGKRRYSRDPINHSKIIELTGRMELKTSSRPALREIVRSIIDAPEQAELDEEVESAETPDKLFLEKSKKGGLRKNRSYGPDDLTCLDVDVDDNYYIQR